jgi:hypothetical protein
LKIYLPHVSALAGALLLASCSSPTNQSAGGSTTAPSPTEQATVVKSLPFNASGLLGGTALPNLADGDPGKVSVVQVGPLQKESGALIFAFRNNTTDGISDVDWTATARSGGSIVATGSSQGTIPAQVKPGETGLAYIYFDNSAVIPDDAEYEFTVSTTPIDTSFFNTAPLKVTDATLVGDSIVGSAANQTGEGLTGPYSVPVYCFEGDQLTSQFTTYAEQDGDIADGGTVTFSAPLYGDVCASYVVGVNGYFS